MWAKSISTKFNADFKSVKKNCKKCFKKLLIIKCDRKMHLFHFYSCSSNWFACNFLWCIFWNFLTDLKSAWNSVFWYTYNVFPQNSLKIIAVLALFANFEARHAINGSKIEKLLGIQFCYHHRACVIFFSLKKSNSTYPICELLFFFWQ